MPQIHKIHSKISEVTYDFFACILGHESLKRLKAKVKSS